MVDNADKELDAVLDELDTLLKNPDVESMLAGRGVNTSLAMLIVDALGSYLKGKKSEAVEDLGTAVEEIAARLANAGAASGPAE